ncbi:hypothetical protein Poli38472_013474 [Pythium oligandrum]|uniref:Thioredoxin domain-containing protein n=1 Tax=Pythium oligandrum TaxID=41045 RepID=A0A8K1C7R1_PYTOL|nr:hypothetical protein Poli38472_013474 [Pythium oligandrum]|eukprot:TMW58000.1 hypothetical protein Poli38472_013474 [Pythium oligandrum]
MSTRAGSTTFFQRFADAVSTLRAAHWNITAHMQFARFDVEQPVMPIPAELRSLGIPVIARFQCAPFMSADTTATTLPSNCSIANSNIEVYTGGRSSIEIQRYMLALPPREVLVMNSRAEVAEVVKSKPFVVLFVVGDEESQAFSDCQALAKLDIDTNPYLAVTAETLRADHSFEMFTPSSVPSMLLFREQGTRRLEFDKVWSRGELTRFIQRNRYYLLATYSPSESNYFFDRTATAHVLLFSEPKSSYHEALLAQVEDIAQSYYTAETNPSRIILRFVVVSDEEKTLRNAFVITDEQLPAVVVMDNVTTVPMRLDAMGEELVWEIKLRAFGWTLSYFLHDRFPPFMTGGVDDDGEPIVVTTPKAWWDYSDLFEEDLTVSSTTVTFTSPRPLVALDTTELGGNWMERALLETNPMAIDELSDITELVARWDNPENDERVLVLFYSPRCGACQDAMTVLEELLDTPPSRGFRLDRIVKIDVETVDLQDLRGEITLRLLPSVQLFLPMHQVVEYPSRVLRLDDLVEFLGLHTS